MKQVRLPQFYERAESVWKKFLQALPVIIFFLILFYFVIYFFGMEYTMIVSLITVVFQVNYKKDNIQAMTLVRLLVQQLILLLLAYIATWNIILSLILNLVVPFWLIFTKASQFNQLGYFSTMMTFTFMQFMPADWERFITQFEVMIISCIFVFITIQLYQYINRGKKQVCTERKVMQFLGSTLKKFLKGEDISNDLKELFRLQRLLYQEANNKRGKKHVVTTEGKLQYMFALLIQRTVYLMSNHSSVLRPADEDSRNLALDLAEYMQKSGDVDFLSGSRSDNSSLEKEGRSLLTEAEKENDIFHRHVANFFRMFLFILHQSEIKDRGILSEQWEVPTKHRFKEKIFAHFRPDTFEMRFALRMSVVLMAGMAFNLLFYDEHSYWFVMNAFLLLRPMYEDSNYRIRTRFLGTAVGCIIVVLVLPFCNTIVSHLILSGIMVACMYTATPGTVIHALFVTCFALSMTTLAIGETMAVFLRMTYIAAAVLFVLIINRFFFPTSLGSQVRYNLQLLFHMHHMYLRMLEDSLTNQLDYWRICDAQIQYHTVLAQIRSDLPKIEKDDKDRVYYNEILDVTWCMASEIQQMFFQIKHKKRRAEARKIMEQYILYTDYVLNLIQEMMHLKKEKKLKNIEGLKYQRHIEREPELSLLMTQYARNLSRLYVLVLKRVR